MECAGRRMGQRRRDVEGTSSLCLIFQVELASSVTMILYYLTGISFIYCFIFVECPTVVGFYL